MDNKLMMAKEATLFSQCGQYNLPRMLKRKDEFSAQNMLSDALKHAMRLYHYAYNACPPDDKCLEESIKNLPDGDEFLALIEMARNIFFSDDKACVSEYIENIGAYIANLLYGMNEISDVDPYLEHHADELIYKSEIANLNEKELIDKIVKIEFNAFDKVKNEGGRASCQDDWTTFSIMRKSQYLTWNKTMLIQYLYDFEREYNIGHNLITEKYGRMMASTAPDEYEKIKSAFPVLTEEKKVIIEQIVGVQMAMMEDFAKDHPRVAMNARSLYTREDNFFNTSYETYLRGEISTYSDKMLQLYAGYVVDNAKHGRNIAHIIIENTAKLYGFANMDEFEGFTLEQ